MDVLKAPRLAVDLGRFLYAQRVTGFTPPTAPHFDPETTAFFRAAIPNAKHYLEYGSGGSTVLAGSLGIPTVSVESDPFYAAAVRKGLAPEAPVEILTPDLGPTRQWGWPMFGARRKGALYVEAPRARVAAHCPDLILVDGRYRVACALAVARWAKQAGQAATLIVDDYAERAHYHGLVDRLGPPRRVGRSAVFALGEVDVDEAVARQALSDPR